MSPLESRDALTLLHLSDLHFGHGSEASTRFDQQMVTAAILKDAALMRQRIGPPDFVLVTGDIAFSANPSQYDVARKWLDQLAHQLGLTAQQILVVPGNHDVDRGRAVEGYSSRVVHETLRKTPASVDNCVADPKEMELLWRKLEAFSAFSSHYGVPSIGPGSPFWRVEKECGLGKLAFVGLNTVLLSFDNGDNPLNLALGKGQLSRVVDTGDKEALLVVLQHHPAGWLQDGMRLEAMLQDKPHIIFSGHVHRQRGLVTSPTGEHGLTEFSAGAGHADAGDEGSHAYAWLQVRKDGYRFYPRVWIPSRHQFVAERNRFHIEEEDDSLPRMQDELPAPFREWLQRSGQAPTQQKPVEAVRRTTQPLARVETPAVLSPAVLNAPEQSDTSKPSSPSSRNPIIILIMAAALLFVGRSACHGSSHGSYGPRDPSVGQPRPGNGGPSPWGSPPPRRPH